MCESLFEQFVNRDGESSSLNFAYRSGRSEIIPIYSSEELEGNRLALVKKKTNSKVKLVVEEMDLKQARLFSQPDMGVCMENRLRDDLLLIGTMETGSLAIGFWHIFESTIGSYDPTN